MGRSPPEDQSSYILSDRPRNISTHIRADRRSRLALAVVVGLMLLTVFADFLANERPLLVRESDGVSSPAIHEMCHAIGLCRTVPQQPESGWVEANFEFAIRAPIPYSPGTLDRKNSNSRGPFEQQDVRSWRYRHWLGTDALGRDVTAVMIHGARIAFVIGILSMLVALAAGIPLGAAAGYFGNSRLRLHPFSIVLLIATSASALWFLSQMLVQILEGNGLLMIMSTVFSVLSVIAMVFILRGSDGRIWPVLRDSSWKLPLDFLVMRVVEILRSVPSLFLVFALLAVVPDPGIIHLVLIIGLLRIPAITRYVRSEALKLRDRNFVIGARMIGLGDTHILRRHIIPNSLEPVAIHAAFGIGGAILIESALSFLGVGLGIEQMTWGRLLSGARADFAAWWLALLPGAAIFFTVAAFNRIGESLSEYFEGRN